MPAWRLRRATRADAAAVVLVAYADTRQFQVGETRNDDLIFVRAITLPAA